MTMSNPQQLFLHELSDMYDAERRIVSMLPVMAQECDNPQIKTAFEQHEQETQQQIQNLEQCFRILGKSPEKVQCSAIAGLKQEHDSFLKESPSPEVLGLFDLSGASKTEYYEMASYKGLIESAGQMGQQQVAQLLQQNYEQEKVMANKVEQLCTQLGKQAVSQAH
jgi:ferritin-like metal-binding protein YciE